MFTTRVYPETDIARIHWDGTNMKEGSPAVLEVAGGWAYLSDELFEGPGGKDMALNSPERASLALLGAGLRQPGVNARLEAWFGSSEAVLSTLRQKLCVPPTRRFGEDILLAAREKDLLLSEPSRSPKLTPIRESYRQRALDLMNLLGMGMNYSLIGQLLDLSSGGISMSLKEIADDVGFSQVQRLGQFLLAVSITADLPPDDVDYVANPQSLIRPMTTQQRERFFPELESTAIEWAPFPVTCPHIKIRFTGQPPDADTPDMRMGGIDQLKIAGAVIEVNNVLSLSPRELASIVLRHVGVGPQAASAYTAAKLGTSGDYGQQMAAFAALLSSTDNEGRGGTISSMRAAFQQGMYTTLQRPNLTDLSPEMRTDLLSITDSIAQGGTLVEAGQSIGRCAATAHARLRQARCKLGLDIDPDVKISTNVPVFLVTEAERWFNKKVILDKARQNGYAA